MCKSVIEDGINLKSESSPTLCSCLSLIFLKIYHLSGSKTFYIQYYSFIHKAQCKYCYTHLRGEKPRINMVKQYSQYFQNKYLAEQEFNYEKFDSKTNTLSTKSHIPLKREKKKQN